MAVLAQDDNDPETCQVHQPEPASMCSAHGMDDDGPRDYEAARNGMLLLLASAVVVIAALAAIFC